MTQDIETVRNWLHDIAKLDLEDIVADSGVTSGMVVQQEALGMAARLDDALAASRRPVEPPVPDGWVLVPRDEDARSFSDSQLPMAMIEAGKEVLDRAADDLAGNSVSPPPAAALLVANYCPAEERMAA